MAAATELIDSEAIATTDDSSGGVGASPADSDLLEILDEVEHDVGNLMHRMYYWCESLEQFSHGNSDALEATGELRESMSELYRLISRTTDLMRPLQVHTFEVGVGDVCRRIMQRLGCNAHFDESVLGRFCDREVRVDPMPLDRALDMIAEALGCTDRQCGPAIDVQVKIEKYEGPSSASSACSAYLHLDLRLREASSKDLRQWRPGGASERICQSLAARILDGFGWKIESSVNAPSPSCTIIIPL